MPKKQKMKKRKLTNNRQKALKWIENFTDSIIPFLLVLLGIMIILENPLLTLVHLENYEPWITLIDYVIVAFFVIDLIFKWFKVKGILSFLKMYWLDIIAVFPFFLIFRLYIRLSTLVRIGAEIREAQQVVHEAVLIREAHLIREAEIAKELRLLKEMRPVLRVVRLFQRFLRFLKGRAQLAKVISKSQ